MAANFYEAIYLPWRSERDACYSVWDTELAWKKQRRTEASSPAISDFCFIKAEVYPWMVPESDKQQKCAYTSDQFSLSADLHCFAQILFTSFSLQHKT